MSRHTKGTKIVPQIVDEMPKGLLGNKTMRGIQYQGEMYILETDCREMVNAGLQKHFQRANLAEAERDALTARCVELEKALQAIADLDPATDSDEGVNEWGYTDCFSQAQKNARAALAPQKQEAKP